MNRIAGTFILMLFLIFSCTSNETFKVEGRVTDETLNGSKIYFVALDGPVSRNVDSTFIMDGRFTFAKKADSLCIKILRVPVRYPNAVEDLVVVTESGNLNVVLSGNSHGEGTRLNNILQSWKEQKRAYDSVQWELYSQKSKKGINQESIDSLMKYSEALNKSYRSDIISLMNENIYNGIGLLFFKVYYQDLTAEVKNRVLRQTGNLYSRKDAQLKMMIDNDRNAEK